LHDGDAAALDRDLQEQVCGTFHYALRLQPGGGRWQENRRTAWHRCARFLEWKRCAHLVRAGRSGDWNREIRWRRQRVIEHALPDARIRGNFEPSGLICTIEMPLAPPEERL